MTTPKRAAVIHGFLLLFAVALVARSAKVQVANGKDWVARAKRQHYFAAPQSAPRGEILDASGNTLVESQELTRVAVALPEIRDTAFVIRALRRAKIDADALRAASARRRRWIELPGLYSASDVASLSRLNGIHLTPVLQRVYANSLGIQRIVGALDARGNPVTGLELALDTVLRGDSGRVRLARDKTGRPLDTPDGWSDDAKPGSNVVLTINNSLQDICERTLGYAVDSLHANGGDIVMMNPHTGEILALASKRVGTSSLANTAVTEPFEPGSTLKPFVAAALIEKGRARPTDIVNTHNGQLELDGRTINDMHKASQLSLADVIRYSSNIGIVEFGQRLTPREKYEMYRDLGFGMPLGVPLPAESPGILREPRGWSKQTPASILMGYEIAVTPLQLVAAYAAIANGGELMEPHLVKEVRSNDGRMVYRAEPRAIRRVMSGETARTVQQMLRAVVEEGTATKADLATFEVAGKSGTARRTAANVGYSTGNYTASFVGLFPANDPQYVVLVKLDSPKGAHYAGGDIAAPVTQVILRAALAARDAALDRQNLAASEKVPIPATRSASKRENAVQPRYSSSDTKLEGVTAAAYDPNGNVRGSADDPGTPVLIELPSTPRIPPVPTAARAIPDVHGLSLRAAVRVLHQAGFRVRLVDATSSFTLPAAGALASPGTIVQLSHSGD